MSIAINEIEFDKVGERFYETGVKNCVLYPYADTAVTHGSGDDEYSTHYEPGVAWNGITTITESPSGAEATALYADDTKYLNLISNEDFGATIEAYTYPDEFAACDGSAAVTTGVTVSQQKRKTFGLCYKTTVGNDEGKEHYKLHIVYGATAAPSEKAYATINDSPEAIAFSWELSTIPVELGTINNVSYKPTAHIEIDSAKANATCLTNLLKCLYGKNDTSESASDGIVPHLPMPETVIKMMTPST